MQKTVLNYLENGHRYEYLKIVKRFGENCKKDEFWNLKYFLKNIKKQTFEKR